MRNRQQSEALCIDLTNSDEDTPLSHRCARGSQKKDAGREGRRKQEGSAAKGLDDDDDCVLVKAIVTKKRGRKSPGSHAPNAKRSRGEEHVLGDEEDLAIVGTAGQDILRDLPHQRPDCAEHKFSSGACCKPNAQHCAQCYCFVCDVKASDCCVWGSGSSGRDHCNAHSTEEWKQQRSLARQNGRPKGPPEPAVRPSPPQQGRPRDSPGHAARPSPPHVLRTLHSPGHRPPPPPVPLPPPYSFNPRQSQPYGKLPAAVNQVPRHRHGPPPPPLPPPAPPLRCFSPGPPYAARSAAVTDGRHGSATCLHSRAIGETQLLQHSLPYGGFR